MQCFFRSLPAWEHLAALDAVGWSEVIYSTAHKSGSVTVVGEHPELSGSWAILNGRLYYAAKASPSGGVTSITLDPPIRALARDLVYTGTGTEVLETYIADQITSNYIDQLDASYAMPYLSVSVTGSTSAELAYATHEVYPIEDVLELAEELGIGYAWTMGSSSLHLTIGPRATGAHNIFWDDGHNQLVSVSVTEQIVAKVTCRRISVVDDLISVSSTKTYYWHADGSITETPPSPRIPGKWSIVSVTDNDIELSVAAAEAMANNSRAVKIVFASDRSLGLGDRITCRLNGKLVTSTITAATVSRDDDRTIYELGDLPTTLTDKFSAAAQKRREKSVTYEQTEDTPLSASGGTIGGSLNVNDGLKTNVLVVGSASYGESLPADGAVGQVFFLLS